MSTQIAVRIPSEDLAQVDVAVAKGRFPNRAAAVRAAVEAFVRAEREREIAEEYRQAYGAKPQEEWIGEVGLTLGAGLVDKAATKMKRR